ncbi:MAG: pyrroline-5-carboxylate reductase [Proteobacteria bacterium]|nr:pyrroline-5-carboxylate reductase [Pseudomonadota bacterium]
MTSSQSTNSSNSTAAVAFIGGGNMASAIIGGLIERGMPPAAIRVVEPFDQARAQLKKQFGVDASEAANDGLTACETVVWAVKPQTFREAAAPVAAFTRNALHLSVAAGIRASSVQRWLGVERVARAMPNTPALVGKGMTGLFAGPAVDKADRERVESLLRPTGDLLWLEREEQLDAVTALSGSGPAYVFYFLEAMVKAGAQMGLSESQARHLAVGTFSGASALAASSGDTLETMRQRVTSKGGTTHAAITAMDEGGVQAAFIRAMEAARRRADEMGEEFGRQ